MTIYEGKDSHGKTVTGTSTWIDNGKIYIRTQKGYHEVTRDSLKQYTLKESKK